MKKKDNLPISQRGFSLVEILVSIVLLGLIAGSFVTFFVQSARTNNVSDNITDATYSAQQQIEDLYNLSNNYTLSAGKTYLTNTEKFSTFTCTSTSCTANKTDEKGNYVTIEIKNPDSNQISNALVQVYDLSKTKLRAQMETKLIWKN